VFHAVFENDLFKALSRATEALRVAPSTARKAFAGRWCPACAAVIEQARGGFCVKVFAGGC